MPPPASNTFLQRFTSFFSTRWKTLKTSHYHQLLLLIILLGIALRVYQYLSFRSLWGDEATLALNIVERTMGKLLTQPLTHNQGAPLLFLFIEKIFTLSLGNNDVALRLFPFLSGIALSVLLPYFSFKTFGRVAGLTTAFLAAVNMPLIYYSSEVKQYAVDALVSFMIFAMFYIVFQHGLKKKQYWQILFVGLFSAVLSHPAIFLLFGCGIVLWIKTLVLGKKQENYRDTLRLTGVFTAWAGFYILLYFLTLKNLSGNNYLTSFWAFAFIPTPPWSDLSWLAALPSDLAGSFMYAPPYDWIIIIFAGLGLFGLWKKNRLATAAVFVAFLGMLLASMLEIYPIKGRMITFVIPLMILLVSLGAELIHTSVEDYKALSRVVIILMLLALSLGSLRYVYGLIQNPDLRYREHILPLVEIIQEERQKGEPLYVFYTAQAAYVYYQFIEPYPDELVFFGGYHTGNLDKYNDEIQELVNSPIVWLLFTRDEIDGIDAKAHILIFYDQNGTRLKEYIEEGASLYLYELYP